MLSLWANGHLHHYNSYREKVVIFFSWLSIGDDSCTYQEVVHSVQAKQTDPESGYTFTASR